MDIETLRVGLTALGSLLAAVVGFPVLRKTLAEFRHLDRGRRRTESDFAFKLAEATGDPVIRRYAEELGYAALTGDRHLTHDQRKGLVSLPDSERDIETYMRTRKLVKVVVDERHFAWKQPRYEQQRYRSLVRSGWMVSYGTFCLLAVAPWLVWGIALRSPWPTSLVGLQACTLLIFSPVAFMSLLAASLINESEQFLKDVEERKARALATTTVLGQRQDSSEKKNSLEAASTGQGLAISASHGSGSLAHRAPDKQGQPEHHAPHG